MESLSKSELKKKTIKFKEFLIQTLKNKLPPLPTWYPKTKTHYDNMNEDLLKHRKDSHP